MPNVARLFYSLLPMLAAIAPSQGAIARDTAPAFMPVGDVADAPFGFADMCVRDKVLCLMGATPMPDSVPGTIQLASTMQGATGAISASAFADASASQRSVGAQAAFLPSTGRISDEVQLRQLAKSVNSRVNRFTVQVHDVGEKWQRPVGTRERFGDCEDLAIEKRAQLTDAGFPLERMFYAVSFVRGYGLHTVLIVRLDDGDYVLDSMAARIKRWSSVKQVWLRRQVEGSPLTWVRPEKSAPMGKLAEATAETHGPS